MQRPHGVLRFLIARPLIAIAFAALVVSAILVLNTHRQTTPVTQRTQHRNLTDEQQTQLGDQQYAKTLREDPAAIVSSGAAYKQVQRVATRIEAAGCLALPLRHNRVGHAQP